MAELLGHRELDFLFHELLDTAALLARPRYREHSREVLDAAIDSFACIAAAQFAPYYRKGGVEEPRFDGEQVHLIPEVLVAWDTLRQQLPQGQLRRGRSRPATARDRATRRCAGC